MASIKIDNPEDTFYRLAKSDFTRVKTEISQLLDEYIKSDHMDQVQFSELYHQILSTNHWTMEEWIKEVRNQQ